MPAKVLWSAFYYFASRFFFVHLLQSTLICLFLLFLCMCFLLISLFLFQFSSCHFFCLSFSLGHINNAVSFVLLTSTIFQLVKTFLLLFHLCVCVLFVLGSFVCAYQLIMQLNHPSNASVCSSFSLHPLLLLPVPYLYVNARTRSAQCRRKLTLIASDRNVWR